MIRFALDGRDLVLELPAAARGGRRLRLRGDRAAAAAADDRRPLLGHLRARRALAAVRRAADRRHPAARAGHDRRVPRAHLRRGQAAPALRRRPRAQPRPRARAPGADRRARSSADAGRGDRRRRRRPRVRAPAHAGAATPATSTSAGPASAGRPRRSTSATGTCSSATTTTCSRATATSRSSTTSSGMPDELEWLPSSVAFFLEGRSWPFTSPLHLLRFSPLSLRSRLRMGVAVLRLQRGGDDVAPFERMTARDWIARRDGRRGLREGLGAAAARQVRRPRRRHLDGVAVGQADDAPQAAGQGVAPGAARLPAPLVGAAVRGAAGADRGRRRARADRPARSSGCRRASRSSTARRARSAPATTRAPSRPPAARALRRRRRHGAQRRLPRRCSTSSSRRRLPRAAGRHRVPHGALPAARARPRLHALLLDQHRRPRAAVRRRDRAHEPDRAASATAGAASCTSRTTSRPGTSCSRSTPTRCWSATRPACGGSTRASTAPG